MRYRKGLPYELYDDLTVYVGLLGWSFEHPFMKLKDGYLTLKAGYSIDGSTAVADTEESMVAAFCHDALCQACREGLLPIIIRYLIDLVYWRLCWRGGMTKLRAWIRKKGLQWFGGGAVLAKNKRKIYEIYHPDEVINESDTDEI